MGFTQDWTKEWTNSWRTRFIAGGDGSIPTGSLLLWLDGSDINTVTKDSSGLVSQWNDKSINGYHATQATGTKQPTYTTNVFNSKSAIVFDGTSDSMTCPNAVRDAVAVGAAHTYFFVNKVTTYTGTGATAHSLFSSALGANDRSGLQANTSSGSQVAATYFDGSNKTASTGASDSNPHIIAVTHAASAVPVMYLDNSVTAGAGSNASINGNAVFRIGADNTNGTDRFFDGWIGEIILYSRVLSTAEIAQVNRYLSAKWGIAIT